MWFHFVTNQLAIFVDHARNRAVKLRCGSGARIRILVCNAFERQCETVGVNRRCTDANLIGVRAKYGIVVGVGCLPNFRCPLGVGARFRGETGLLRRSGRSDAKQKERDDEKYLRWLRKHGRALSLLLEDGGTGILTIGERRANSGSRCRIQGFALSQVRLIKRSTKSHEVSRKG
jgi:hypothetical protein